MAATQAQYHRLMQNAYLQQALQQGTASATTAPWGWVTASSTTATITATASTTANTVTAPIWQNGVVIDDGPYYPTNHDITIRDGTERKINLPDGTAIEVAADGSFTINDKDAKVTYRANRVHDFNPFINASDKLEAFIKFCGQYGVRQQEMLDIPIKLFIGWLVMEAAIADNEPAPHEQLFNDLKKRLRPRCSCGRFLARKLIDRKIAFCRPVCLEAKLNEVAA